MAAGMLPRPGTQVGPCESDCNHVDCRETMAMASAPCRFCGKSIGFQARFVSARFDGCLAHERCLEEAVERNDARVGLF